MLQLSDPSQLHFLSSLLPLHLKAVEGRLFQPTLWLFFKSTAEREVFFHRQYLSTPDTEHLKPEDSQPPKDIRPVWNTVKRSWQEPGKERKNQWQVSRLQTQQELQWGFWHALDLRLCKHWLVLTEPPPGKATTWLQGSLGKQRGESHGKETTLRGMLYAMNFCKCFTAFLHQVRKQCMGFLFCSLEKNTKGALKIPERGIASCKKHLYNPEKKQNFFLPDICKVKDEKKHNTIQEMHTLFL